MRVNLVIGGNSLAKRDGLFVANKVILKIFYVLSLVITL